MYVGFGQAAFCSQLGGLPLGERGKWGEGREVQAVSETPLMGAQTRPWLRWFDCRKPLFAQNPSSASENDSETARLTGSDITNQASRRRFYGSDKRIVAAF